MVNCMQQHYLSKTIATWEIFLPHPVFPESFSITEKANNTGQTNNASVACNHLAAKRKLMRRKYTKTHKELKLQITNNRLITGF